MSEEKTLGELLDDAAKEELLATVERDVRSAVYGLMGEIVNNGWVPSGEP